MVSSHFTRAISHLLLALLFAGAVSSCNVFPRIKNTLRDSLSQGIIEARIDSLLKASADSVLNVVMKGERFQVLRRELDGALRQTSDTLYATADSVLNLTMRSFTRKWLPQINDSLQVMLTEAKNQLTDDQIKNYITGLVGRDLPLALNRLIDQLSNKLHSPEFKSDLADLRVFLDRQLDTLARNATRGAVSVMSDSLLPKIDHLLDKLIQERDRTQKGVNNIIWIILIGIVVILLIAFLIRSIYSNYQYKKMLKLITNEVDKIPSQAVYDKLTKNVSEKMKAEGLEKVLRKDILEDQGLIDQPEWEEKDGAVLKVLTEEWKGLNLSDAQLLEKLKKHGLEAHFESVKKALNS